MTDHPRTAHRPPGPGDRWELVWSHRDELLEIARRRSSSAEEAEDAVHEAMLRAVEDRSVQYGRVRSWLRHATVRVCAERNRQVARDSEVSKSLCAAPPEPRPVEEAACDRAEARWLAARSAELLPARQAEALRLRSQDLDVGQVALAMGLSYRGAESLLARARRQLRGALAGSVTLALTVWVSVRRFPRTGVTQSAVATSAAVTVATVGLSLPAAPSERPDAPPPRAGASTLRPATDTEFPAPRPAPERPRTPPPPSPAPQRAGGADQDTPRPDSGNPPTTYEPHLSAAVKIRISPVDLTTELPSVTTPASIPSLPAGASDVASSKPPPVPSGTAELLPLPSAVVSAR
ncbi:sigma-70 family RNA polymerase sigma factor [Streptomyces sp. NBC_01166]|uniref:RNA polymerase sigma factor n=1 Tax=Streptomyces sp. NBC_01166 TaxID=2903755 RepID=UPI00386A6818|nr:sigma-70 family RNA polymerase sigma factor [Streptomyces sp. NBC_01166]